MAATKKKADEGRAPRQATPTSAKKATGRSKAPTKKAAKKPGAPHKSAGAQSSGAARRAAARRPRPSPAQPSLDELTRLLRDRVTSRVPRDYTRGKTLLRDEVMALLACSSARAEHIVDSMVARGYARFGRHPRFTTDPRFGIWHLDDSP